jgi:hypothetical protein
MNTVPWWVWLLIGLSGLLAFAVGHRHGEEIARVRREGQESGTPLQEFTQPQPYQYGASPFGSQLVYTTFSGAFGSQGCAYHNCEGDPAGLLA